MTTRAEIVAIARETLGTPYQHQCRVNGIAMDCAGVPAHVGVRLGMSFEDVTGYGRQPQPDEMRKALDRNLVRVPKQRLQPGDVVWIRFQQEPQHLAIVGNYVFGGLSLIHAYNSPSVNKVVEHRLNEQWAARIVAAWRFPGVDE